MDCPWCGKAFNHNDDLQLVGTRHVGYRYYHASCAEEVEMARGKGNTMKADEPNGVEVRDPEHVDPEQVGAEVEAEEAPIFSKTIARHEDSVSLDVYAGGDAIVTIERGGVVVPSACDLESLVDLSYLLAQALHQLLPDEDLFE